MTKTKKKKWDYKDIAKWGPGKHELGATIPESGTADDYETGGWKVDRPVRDIDKCTDCMICYWSCPDSAVIVEEGKMVGFDLKHCKGCGICSAVCPKTCIAMENDLEATKKEGEE